MPVVSPLVTGIPPSPPPASSSSGAAGSRSQITKSPLLPPAISLVPSGLNTTLFSEALSGDTNLQQQDIKEPMGVQKMRWGGRRAGERGERRKGRPRGANLQMTVSAATFQRTTLPSSDAVQNTVPSGEKATS